MHCIKIIDDNMNNTINNKYEKNLGKIKDINGLINVAHMDNSFIFDLKYATKENFTGRVIYPVKACILQKETAVKLINAHEEFKRLGYRIKVWDAYRPIYVQKIFWDIVKDERFVANPNKHGSRHNRGTAVDITLVDVYENELKMPSSFDDFSILACRNNKNIGEEERRNLNLLTEIMKKHGFITIDTEWWHFEDSNYHKYNLFDVRLENFI